MDTAMRVDPECVYLRLEPGATLINYKTGATRSVAAIELHWKSDPAKPRSGWQHRTFVESESAPTIGALLREIGEWLDSSDNLEDALTKIERKP